MLSRHCTSCEQDEAAGGDRRKGQAGNREC